MNCAEAREAFSLHLDKLLGPPEEGELAGHLEVCPRCRKELAALEVALKGLRTLPGMSPAAPQGLAQEVMARVEALEGRRARLSAWKRWAASAAAAVLLAAGSLAYAARDAGPAGRLTALELDPAPEQVLPAPPGSGEDRQAFSGVPEGESYTGEGQASPVEPVAGGGGNGEGAPPGPGAGSGVQAPANGVRGETPPPGESESSASSPSRSTPAPIKAASREPLRPVAFMNKERQIQSTFLKVAAGNLDRALKEAAATGTEFNVSSQIIAVQNTGGEQRAAVRFTVAPGEAPALTSRLARLGTVLEERQETEDVTARFAAILEQYRETVERANAARGEEERQRLLSQAEFLEKQLAAWDKEAGQHVVVLWLEKR
ncbi:MAG: zf-HC2 domain-containing protein [Thermoanaerobacteraceae bacterium]|nr:zf-HC2 domain-containing protein [Thermoanaerobacteraceae bacterium]